MEVSMTETNPIEKRQRSLKRLEELEDVCREALVLISEIMSSKKEGAVNSEKMKDAILETSVLFVEMKQLNREVHQEIELKKTDTHKSKQQLDNLNLQYQNLLYEKAHFLREIQLCRDFKSKEKEILLVSPDEFTANAPANLRVFDNQNAHQLMLNRLTFELEQRKILQSKLLELKNKKKAMMEMNQTKRKFLEGLQGRLKSLTKASNPIQQYIAYPITKMTNQVNLSQLLPPPLYILFNQLSAYRDAFEKDIDVNIQGNNQAASEQIRNTETVDVINDAAALAPITTQEKQDDVLKKSTSSTAVATRPALRVPKPDAKIEGMNAEELVKTHPLSIVLELLPKNGGKLSLKFQYLQNLNVITVSLLDENADGNILVNLFPNDSGTELPNQAIYYLFPKADFQLEPSQGRPFKWAQWLAGLHFLPPMSSTTSSTSPPPTDNSSNFSRQTVKAVVSALFSRIAARQALSSQLSALEKLVIPSPPTPVDGLTFPLQPLFQFTSWKKISQADAKMASSPANPFSTQAADDELNTYFQAKFKRDEEETEAVITVSSQYPFAPPIFRLRLLTSSSQPRPAPILGEVKHDEESFLWSRQYNAIEREVNTLFQSLQSETSDSAYWLLSLQLRKLQMSLDVLTEIELQGKANTAKFNQGKFCGRAHRGKDRRLPLSFNSSLGYFDFASANQSKSS